MKLNLKTGFVLFLLISLMIFSPVCLATNATYDNVTVSDDSSSTEATYEFISSDVYKADKDVVIDSTIDGNVFAFGNNVTVTGEIGGDLFVCGDTVTIDKNSYIHGSVFAFANTLEVDGICYDIYAGANKFSLDEDAIVARDIHIATDSITINGQVKKDAYITANNLTFAQSDSTLIAGNLSYSATSEFDIDKSLVGGTINFNQKTTNESTTSEKVISFVKGLIGSLLYTLAIVLLTIWLAPKFKNNAGVIFKKQVPLSLGIGLLASIAIIVGSFVLLFLTSGLGIKISIAAISIFVLALSISQAVFSMGVAKFIAEKRSKDTTSMFIGMTLLVVTVIKLLELITFLGAVVGFFTTIIGLGMILVNLIFKNKVKDNNIVENPAPVKEEQKKNRRQDI